LVFWDFGRCGRSGGVGHRLTAGSSQAALGLGFVVARPVRSTRTFLAALGLGFPGCLGLGWFEQRANGFSISFNYVLILLGSQYLEDDWLFFS